MKITWLGHSCFILQSKKGSRVLLDPYGGDKPAPVTEADVVITSHDHWDHNAANRAQNAVLHIKTAGNYDFKDLNFKEIPCFHDDAQGVKRGGNLISVVTADGIRVCHFGDLGENFSQSLVDKIGGIDIALVCVGGKYTIDAETAYEYVSALKPKVTVPMHYRYNGWFNEVDKVDKFISLWHNNKIMRSTHNFIDFESENLPGENTLIVLQL